MHAELATLQLHKADLETKLSHQMRQTDKLLQEKETLEALIIKLQKQELCSVVRSQQIDRRYREANTERDAQGRCQESLTKKWRQQELHLQHAFAGQVAAYERLFATQTATNDQLLEMTDNFRRA